MIRVKRRKRPLLKLKKRRTKINKMTKKRLGGFNRTGAVHYIGIKNEKNIVNYLNTKKDDLINNYIKKKHGIIKAWEHVGGTGHKEDCVCVLESGERVKVSIKNHKTGTFDWLNTSKTVPKSIIENIKAFRERNKITPEYFGEHGNRLRDELDDIFTTGFKSLSHEQIKEFLGSLYKKYPEYILVNDKKSSSLIWINKEQIKARFIPEEGQTFELVCPRRAKTSRQIWLVNPDGTRLNTHLRIRLVTNNGIRALLGISKKNKNSIPCIKIQQDKVDMMLEEAEKIITPYV